MSPESRDQITWTLSTLIAASVLIGIVVKLVLLPYLREHLVNPMAQVKRQVSENHHHNKEPTVLDRIDDVGEAVESQRTEVRALARVFDTHLAFSDRWVDLIEREIDMIHEEIHKHHPNYRPPHRKET